MVTAIKIFVLFTITQVQYNLHQHCMLMENACPKVIKWLWLSFWEDVVPVSIYVVIALAMPSGIRVVHLKVSIGITQRLIKMKSAYASYTLRF